MARAKTIGLILGVCVLFAGHSAPAVLAGEQGQQREGMLPGSESKTGYVIAWGGSQSSVESLQSVVPHGADRLISMADGTIGLRPDNSVVTWGKNTAQNLEPPKDDGKPRAFSVLSSSPSAYHTLGLTGELGQASRKLYGWGLNDRGQLNIPTDLDQSRISAVAAGRIVSAALVDGKVRMWGASNPNEDEKKFIDGMPPQVRDGGESNNPDPVEQISAGWQHMLALTKSKKLYVWGSAWGYENLKNLPQNPGHTVKAISSGHWHATLLWDDGTVTSWEQNGAGEGASPPAAVNSKFSQIFSGGYYNLGLRENVDNRQELVLWGNNANGTLAVPRRITDSLAYYGAHIKAVATGWTHASVLTDQGQLVTWGKYSESDIAAQVPDATLRASAIAGRGTHTLALSDGRAIGCGSNAQGQVTIPAEAQQGIVAIATGGDTSYAVNQQGKVITWGSPPPGTLPIEALSGVDAVSAGDTFGLARRAGRLVCWGDCRNFPEPSVHTGVGQFTASAYAVALADGKDVAWTKDGLFTNRPAGFATPVRALSASSQNASFIVGSQNKLVSMNQKENIGLPDWANADIAAMTSDQYLGNIIAIKNGSVFFYQSAYPGQRWAPVPDAAKSGVFAVTTGTFASFALK